MTLAEHRAICRDARRIDRQPGDAAGQSRTEAIYLSGWQVAADANTAGQMFPDQSLYPVDSVPNVVKRINNALLRADQIAHSEGDDGIYWMAPIVADAEAGFAGALNAYELMKAMIEAGAAGVHFEDQLASAADVEGVSTVLLRPTDAYSAHLLTSDIDERDHPFITGERTPEGFFRIAPGLGLDYAIARSLAYAPYADLLWWETSEPDLAEAEQFADAIHRSRRRRRATPRHAASRTSPSRSWSRVSSLAGIR